jgi:hypothetical protein
LAAANAIDFGDIDGRLAVFRRDDDERRVEQVLFL